MSKSAGRSILLSALMLISVLFTGTAWAENAGRVAVWKVIAPAFDTETLLDETFDRKTAENTPEIQEEVRKNNGCLWDLEGSSGLPFCGISYWNSSAGVQIHVDIFRRDDQGGKYDYHYGLRAWNSIQEESGFGAVRATETCDRAADLLKRLGFYGEYSEPKPVSFTTLGSMEGATKSRLVVFEELLDGLPVRWSSNDLYWGESRAKAQRNYAEVIYSDEEGLLKMEGYWCDFEPVLRTEDLLSPADAAERFASAGLGNSQPEACWFLHFEGEEATATLAYRVGNTFLSAVDGAWLQIEK